MHTNRKQRMTARKSWDEIMERKHITRMNRDDKTVDKIERLEAKALPLIGELCREGKTVYYVNCHPLYKGKTREGTQADLLAFLIRNKYVI